MRKKFLFAVLGLMTAVGLNAQVKVERGYDDKNQRPERMLSPRKSSQLAIKYGVKDGGNISSMSNKMKFDPGIGMGVGFR